MLFEIERSHVESDPSERYLYRSVLKENDLRLLCGKNFFVLEEQECPRPPVFDSSQSFRLGKVCFTMQ